MTPEYTIVVRTQNSYHTDLFYFLPPLLVQTPQISEVLFLWNVPFTRNSCGLVKMRDEDDGMWLQAMLVVLGTCHSVQGRAGDKNSRKTFLLVLTPLSQDTIIAGLQTSSVSQRNQARCYVHVS